MPGAQGQVHGKEGGILFIPRRCGKTSYHLQVDFVIAKLGEPERQHDIGRTRIGQVTMKKDAFLPWKAIDQRLPFQVYISIMPGKRRRRQTDGYLTDGYLHDG